MTRALVLALALAATPAAADEWTIFDDRRRPVETVSPGIGDHLVRQDPSGRRIGTLEQGVGDRLIVLDHDRRREAVIERGIGGRFTSRTRPAGSPARSSPARAASS